MAQPVAKFRAGQISCAVWKNEAKVGDRMVTMLKATVERRYKDPKTDSWKSSGSFSRNEIPLVRYCLEKAYAYIIEQSAEEEPVPEEMVM